MYLYHNTENDLVINVEQIHFRQQIIQACKKRFASYGYHEIYTPTFEAYDLYANMNGTVNQHEMIKTIDNAGEVLVLRPDITIPITKLIANSNEQLHEDLRYFYIQNVFRQTAAQKNYRENTQAGVEYFGNTSPEADAEIIALAIHLMKDMQLEPFTIELGHAAFFQQLVQDMEWSKEALLELQSAIQAKNITEIEDLLTKLSVSSDKKEILTSLPFLYGEPIQVIEKAKALPISEPLKQTLQNIQDIYDVLHSYGVAQHIVIDLSLINHMDYYSDMIFQGFIEKIGKPILMGGRYNRLANQFNANIPAIGFAFDMDLVLEGIAHQTQVEKDTIDVVLLFDKKAEKNALMNATKLRMSDYRVITYTDTTSKEQIPDASYTIHLTETKMTIHETDQETDYAPTEDILSLLQERRN